MPGAAATPTASRRLSHPRVEAEGPAGQKSTTPHSPQPEGSAGKCTWCSRDARREAGIGRARRPEVETPPSHPRGSCPLRRRRRRVEAAGHHSIRTPAASSRTRPLNVCAWDAGATSNSTARQEGRECIASSPSFYHVDKSGKSGKSGDDGTTCVPPACF